VKKILIIDDDDRSSLYHSQLITDSLGNKNVSVYTNEKYDFRYSEEYDLIITDLHLGSANINVLDSLERLYSYKIKNKQKIPKIILHSGSNHSYIYDFSKLLKNKAPFDISYTSKSSHKKDLLHKVKRMLEINDLDNRLDS